MLVSTSAVAVRLPCGVRLVDQEIAFAGGIDRKHIKGAWEIDLRTGTKGEWIPNPHYEPHIPKKPVAPAPEAPPSSQLPEGWTQ
ncbi:scabin-related ADP-ribosyltransferase [Streptomyces lydicus]|uniref:scabin-related ADP-ribosyltransferase n=1 Tax=Streptomyces lydicus TaxID=47763 RepID=UPI0035BE4180